MICNPNINQATSTMEYYVLIIETKTRYEDNARQASTANPTLEIE